MWSFENVRTGKPHMEVFSNAIENTVNYLSTMGVSDFVDIIIVAYLVYQSIWWVRRNKSHNLARGIILLLIVLWCSEFFNLTMINFLMRRALELGLIAVLILFQPELRRMIERVGSSLSSGKSSSNSAVENAIAQTVLACTEMASAHTGALIIFERTVSLTHSMSTGTIINADITSELLKNIFYDKAPLHDGAVIIRDCRIASAGSILPLTQSTNLSKELGMRHRAGIGLSEQSDAVVIIVSEESGTISMAIDGMLKRHLNSQSLDKLLHQELVKMDDEESKGSKLMNNLKNIIKVLKNEEEQDKKNI